MNIHFLCNIGHRDLQILDAQGEPEILKPPRSRGEEVYISYSQVKDRLVLPLITPALDHILAVDALTNPSASSTLHVYLLGTDQPDPRYQESDTCFFALTASRMVKETYGSRVIMHEDLVIDGINPAMYDEAYERVGKLLSSVHPASDEPVYILLAGGIPACNTALLLQGVRFFGRDLVALYKPPDKEPQLMRAGRQIITAFSEAAVIERLRELDFANALPQLEGLASAREIAGLVRYAAQRLAFDFSSAQLTLEQAYAEASYPTRQFIDQHLRRSLDDLLKPASGHLRLLALLKELTWNAGVVYQHHQYADFLGRVYRFQEAILRYLVETVYGVSTDLSPAVREQNQHSWEEMLKSNPAILEFARNRVFEGKKLDPRIIGRPSYQALMSYATGNPPGTDGCGKPLLPAKDISRFHSIVDRVNKLDKLVELRHRTIIGHDFEGVSEKILIERTPGKISPAEYLTSVMAELCQGEDVKTSDYQRIASFVIEKVHGGAA